MRLSASALSRLAFVVMALAPSALAFPRLSTICDFNTPKKFLVSLTGKNDRARTPKGLENAILNIPQDDIIVETYNIGSFQGYAVKFQGPKDCMNHFTTMFRTASFTDMYEVEDLEEDPHFDLFYPVPELQEEEEEEDKGEEKDAEIEDRVSEADSEDIEMINAPVLEGTGVQVKAPWGLDRIDQEDLPLDSRFVYPERAGEDVDVYVVDSGVNVEHDDFGGRASWGIVTASYELDEIDHVGHGSHVAGIVAGATYGAAKKANIIAVKVLGAAGGTGSDILRGLEFVANRTAETGRKSVINMSLGGFYSPLMNQAVGALTDLGIHVVVAGGNDAKSSCRLSPASASREYDIITVGATNKSDEIAKFSSDGPCVSIFAPGVAIMSVHIPRPVSVREMDGTSMASPLVAGVVANILSYENLSPKEMKEYLLGVGLKDRVINKRRNANETTSTLLYLPHSVEVTNEPMMIDH